MHLVCQRGVQKAMQLNSWQTSCNSGTNLDLEVGLYDFYYVGVNFQKFRFVVDTLVIQLESVFYDTKFCNLSVPNDTRDSLEHDSEK